MAKKKKKLGFIGWVLSFSQGITFLLIAFAFYNLAVFETNTFLANMGIESVRAQLWTIIGFGTLFLLATGIPLALIVRNMRK